LALSVEITTHSLVMRLSLNSGIKGTFRKKDDWYR